MALAVALQIVPGVLGVLSVDLSKILDVDLGLEGNLDGRGFLVASPVLAPHPAMDTVTSRQQRG